MADDVIRIAAKHTAAGRLDEAAATLSAALRHDHRAHAVRYELGLVEAQRGDLAAAEKAVRAAIAAGGNIYGRGLGHILAKAGKLDEAELWLNRAVQSNANDAWALANLGALYGDQRKHDQAIASLQRALSIQPDFPWARTAFDRLSGERTFLQSVRSTYRAVRGAKRTRTRSRCRRGRLVEFPAAPLDANGKPRFVMRIPASMILGDLGAAHLFYQEVAGRGYEFALRRFLELHVESDDVFIDVGAHWGVHALTCATRWPHAVTVLAIEAHPANCARLREWVQGNGLETDIEIIPKAIGEREGLAHMRVNASSMGHSLGPEGIEVEMTTLDALLADRDWMRWRRVILKIDVEGYEMEALAGATRLFSTCDVGAVIWEMSEFREASEQKIRNDANLRFLSDRGFEHFRFEDDNKGGALGPLVGNERFCNVYSLSRSLPPA